MLISLREQEADILVTLKMVGGKFHENRGASCSEVSRDQVIWDIRTLLEGRELIAASSTSYCYVMAS